jgi:hypothetical protein
LEDPRSEVSQVLQRKPSYRLLEDVGTQPRVWYVGGHPPHLESRLVEEIKERVEP